MQQAAAGEGLSVDPLPFEQDRLAPAEVDVGWAEMARALVGAGMIVGLDESTDLGLQIPGQIVVLEQDAVLERSMPALDLALGLGMTWGTPDVHVERRLAAILAADVVGYSRLIEADEAGTLVALRDLRQKVLEPLLTEHRGRIVKLMGDGIIAELGSVVSAVSCAAATQVRLAKRRRLTHQSAPSFCGSASISETWWSKAKTPRETASMLRPAWSSFVRQEAC
jgi:hypothetical protein